MKDKLITVLFFAGLANLIVSLAAYDYIALSRIFGIIALALFLIGFVLMTLGHRKRTRCAGKHNESKKAESNKDLIIIIHRVLALVKAGDVA